MSENNYTPNPIEALTSHTVEQRTLDVLLRIEGILLQRFNQQTAMGKQAVTENTRGADLEVVKPKGKGRFGR